MDFLFPYATVTAELHLLEDHVVPFFKKWGVWFRVWGEHGAESLYARFNSIQRVLAKMTNLVKRLHSIMNEHLQACPDNLENFPMKEKRGSSRNQGNPRTPCCLCYPAPFQKCTLVIAHILGHIT